MINIRTIQHFLYCPTRWYLLEYEQMWKENAFVANANIIHKRVDRSINYNLINGVCETSVPVYNHELNIKGIIDCLEFIKDENGVYVKKFDNYFRLNIVEYDVSDTLII